MTQKEKINGYDALAAERDLLSLYFYDRETGRRIHKVTVRCMEDAQTCTVAELHTKGKL